MTLNEILPRLRHKFPPDAHKERKLPGGKVWWFIPWQQIRERLDEVCPDMWEVSYSAPIFVDEYCSISCTISIAGISRQGIGSAKIQLLSNEGNDMARGNPIERATADAFKNAAEAWGIARYLDDQADDKTKREFIKYMHQGGNSKPALQYQDQQRAERGEAPKPKAVDPPSQPFGSRPARSTPEPKSIRAPIGDTITEDQQRELYAIATKNGYTGYGFRQLVESAGFPSGSKDITKAKYAEILGKAQDKMSAAIYNNQNSPVGVG